MQRGSAALKKTSNEINTNTDLSHNTKYSKKDKEAVFSIISSLAYD